MLSRRQHLQRILSMRAAAFSLATIGHINHATFFDNGSGQPSAIGGTTICPHCKGPKDWRGEFCSADCARANKEASRAANREQNRLDRIRAQQRRKGKKRK